MSKYPQIFSPGKIGKMTVKNKIVMPAMGTSLATLSGEVSSNTIEYYKARAKGGTGLIIVEVAEINNDNGRAALNMIRIDTSNCIPQMRRLTDAVHIYDTKIFVQLHHGGNQASKFMNDGAQTVSASDVQSLAVADRPRALANEEVKDFIKKYIYSATLAKMSHFDGVEIHGGHGYLVNQFLSPHMNRRTDEYGGSFENRMRFATEIIRGIKAACGEDFPISIRLSIDEYTDHGYGLEEGVKIAKAMEEAGVDIINCSFGSYESYPMTVEPTGFEQGWRVYMAEEVKKSVKIPVMAVGQLRTPEFIEKVLEDGRADFIAIGRGLIADPEWCNKAMRGREKEIRYCISCMSCLEKVLGCGQVSCAVNPRAGHEFEYGQPKKDGNGRKVVVVGAGPGGMEAAITTSERGFNTILLEKNASIGGQLELANKPLGKEKINWFVDFYKNQLDKLGVDVRLNCDVNAEMIKAEDPYAVFIATGGSSIIPNLPGINNSNVITAEEFLSGDLNRIKDKNVVVVGGGVTGSESAGLLGSKGNKVTLVEMMDEVCTGCFPDTRTEIMIDIDKYNVEIKKSTKLKEVKENGVFVENLKDGKEEVIAADYVILALGVRPVNALYDELFNDYENLFKLGDAVKQGKFINAVNTGYVRALELA